MTSHAEWMPIDSAPRDGTWILASVKGWIPAVARWTTDWREGGSFEYVEAETFAEESHWRAFIETTEPWQPTHWLLLPPPPKESD